MLPGAGCETMPECRRAGARKAGPVCAICALLLIWLSAHVANVAARGEKKLDPAAWGQDHVGKPVPEYMTGDECLFCHRKKVSQTWNANAHQRTLRRATMDGVEMRLFRLFRPKDNPKDVDYLLGDGKVVRYLRRTSEYGKLELHSSVCRLPVKMGRGSFSDPGSPAWSATEFGAACAGCHTTAVNSESMAFSSISIDCFACHGDVTLAHTKDTSQVHLSVARNNSPREIASICGQCHLRHGKSRSSGLPYPKNFVAGDNLFRDFAVDFGENAFKEMDAIDRHVAANIRDIVIEGKGRLTCLSCHNVHAQSTDKHQTLPASSICMQCHTDPMDWRQRSVITRSSRRCQYE